MSLVAVPPAPQSPASAFVRGDGWYPDIDCNAARDVLRLGDVVTHARLVAALSGAMLAIGGELRAWRAARIAEGKTSLAAVSAETVDDLPALEVLYTRAVRFTAAAELAELHRAVSATSDGAARADSQLLSAADYRRLATHAVRDILGTTRTAVELI